MELRIGRASLDQMDEVRALFREYRASVDAEICFSTYEQELAALPAGYDFILIASSGQSPVAVVAVRRVSAREAEMKRLFVRASHQGQGLGRRMVQACLEEGRACGYEKMLLDTLPGMANAIELYRAMGFVPIPRYNDNPDPQALFFEKQLS
jgi:GNAT superfamily N-acetyltransferase